MNGDFPINVEEVIRHIEEAEVLCIYFPILGKTLVVDTRDYKNEGPLVKVMPMVNSIEERIAVLKRLRPGLPRPRSFVVIPWTKHIKSLRLWGVWDKLSERLGVKGDSPVEEDLSRAFYDLLYAEAEEIRKAIRGDDYHTIWQSSA